MMMSSKGEQPEKTEARKKVRYKVVFYGEVLSGASPERVKQNFTKAFKLSPERVEQIFLASKITLKSNLDEVAARHYQRQLEQLGALGVIETVSPIPSVTSSDKSSEVDVTQTATAGVQAIAPQVSPQEVSMAKQDTVSPARPTVPPASHRSEESERTLPFLFHGSGSEYFRIWIVNILLSVVTLGIYSAWAKVRNKQYFYGNTELDGSTFSYLASPIAILKGRVIAVALFIGYSLMSNVPIWWVSLMALGIVLLASPFFVQRSLMFNARNSAYRSVRFNFEGTFKESALIFAGIPILFGLTFAVGGGVVAATSWFWLMLLPILIVFGVGVPFFLYQQKRFFIDNSLYGTSCFELDVTSHDFYRLWGKLVFFSVIAFALAIGLLVLVMALFGVSMGMLSSAQDNPELWAGAMVPILISTYLIMGIVYLFPLVYYQVRMNNLVYNNASIDGFQLEANYALVSYGKLVFVNTLLTILTLGLYRPWALVRTAQYRADHMRVNATASMDQFVASESEHVSALGEELGELYDLDFGF